MICLNFRKFKICTLVHSVLSSFDCSPFFEFNVWIKESQEELIREGGEGYETAKPRQSKDQCEQLKDSVLAHFCKQAKEKEDWIWYRNSVLAKPLFVMW